MYHSFTFKPTGKQIARVVKKNKDPETGKVTYEKTKKFLSLIESDDPIPNAVRRVELKKNEQFFPVAVRQEGNHTNRVFLGAGTLSGKSFLANEYAQDYKKRFPKNKVILVTGLPKDNDDYSNIKNLHRIRIDEDNILNNPIALEEFHDSLTIFDDILACKDKEIVKELSRLRDQVLSAGRQENIDCLVLQQNLLDGHNTKSCHANSFQIVGFPRTSSKYQLMNYLENHHKMNKAKIDEFMHKPTRWVLINNVNPLYYLTEKDCELK